MKPIFSSLFLISGFTFVQSCSIADKPAGAIPPPPGFEIEDSRQANTPAVAGGQYKNHLYKVVNPLPVKSYFKDKNGVREEIYFEDMSRESLRDYLSQSTWTSTIEKIESGATVGISMVGFTGEKGNYKITLDYARFETENVSGSISYARVGVGVRITADVQTRKDHLKIQNLQMLSAAYNKKSISGNVKVEKFGITSDRLTLLTPPIGAISEELLKEAERYAVNVISAIDDDGTKLKPYIIAVGHTEESSPPQISEQSRRRRWFWQ